MQPRCILKMLLPPKTSHLPHSASMKIQIDGAFLFHRANLQPSQARDKPSPDA